MILTRGVRLLAAVLSLGIGGAQAQTISLAQSPLLASNAAAVKPNLNFVLDDSGSMDWDFVPDWINYNASGSIGAYCKATGTGRTTCCRSASNGSNCMTLSANNTNATRRGEPPFTNNDFNGVYYNPTITYAPPIRADGTSFPSYTTYTAVPEDGLAVAPATTGVQSSYTLNLTTSYPDLEYCDAGGTNCLRSDNYLLPGTIFGTAYTTARMTDVSHAANVASTTADFVSGTLAAPTLATRALGPYYYLIIPGEYCTNKKLTNCTVSAVPTVTNPYPAKLRWCANTALTTCQALKTATYQYPRYPTLVQTSYAYATASITVAVAQNAAFTISSISTGTTTLATSIICSSTSATCNTSNATAATRNRAVAVAIQNAINANTASTGFGADATAAVVKISAPAGVYSSALAMAATQTSPSSTTALGTIGFALGTPFSGGSAGGTSVPGAFKRIDIVSGQTYGNLWIDAGGAIFSTSGTGRALLLDRSTRTDCAAAPTCTYAEEMSNFANWYAYYHTRMQMMKTALSRAFASVPNNKYRIGLFTINSGALGRTSTPTSPITSGKWITGSLTGSAPNRYSNNGFVDIGLWSDTQREYWYNTMFKTSPSGGTPLRQALSSAGRIYANMLKGAADPVEESCQQNFTILSTDGYWNGSGGVRISGGDPSNPTTASMDDQDGATDMAAWGTVFPTMATSQNWPRPYLDGSNKADTLADSAAYYYFNDLRQSAWGNCVSGASGHDTCTDDVPTTRYDTNNKQHMVTFTIGLINGVMQYRDNYLFAPSAGDIPDDYTAITSTTAASGGGTCLWQASGTCTWPTPAADSQNNIDDLWHAAVNGHGIYYNARNPAELASGLTSALATVNVQLGSAAAATTSSPNISRNNNFALSTTYTTVEWSGDLFLQTIDLNTGLLSSSKVWSAQGPLDGINPNTRNVWMFTTATASYPSKLKPFKWANLIVTDASKSCGDAANEPACFSSPYINSLSQFCSTGPGCLDATGKTNASGSNLLNFLRGETTNYAVTDTTSGNITSGYFRRRAHVLGDIVNSEATYVQNSPFAWDESTNPGYTAFAAGNYSRAGAVYVAANDGMVHALDATDGTERWAYVPSMVLPNLYKLADTNYSHQYFVDATPVIGDADAGGWKTLLVGGLGGGGVGYYALDVTNPASPQGLWEFKRRTSACAVSLAAATGLYDDCDLGNSYGNPVITKYCTAWTGVTSTSSDGTPLNGTCSAYTWAVIVTSGYNNVSSSAYSGKGILYVLNAANGQILKKLATTVGDSVTPSNLGRVNVWANSGMQDNVATTAYAGDMQGNLWRFNLVSGAVTKLAALGAAKPITAKPMLGYVGNQYRVVYVPTGRLLSNTAPYDDLNLAATQGFYAIWDKNDGSTWIAPSGFVAAPVTCSSNGNSLGDCTATSAATVFDGVNAGWYLNFAGVGERGYTDPELVFGVIIFSTGSPNGSACSPSGSGRIWALDFASGGLVKGATKAASSVAYMPPRPVAVSIGGRIEVIEGNAGGTGASALGSGSGLQFSSTTSSWGGACLTSNTCPQVPRHTIWRILPD